ncbi:MAG: hypothetical protein KGN02_12430 [bacterium]|nr:hypothetical protein [bacterium]
MRLIRRFEALRPRHDAAHLRALLRVESLVVARFEPMSSLRLEGYVDLVFERDDAWLVVPMLRVDGVSVMVPELAPIAWPSHVADLAGADTDAIDERIAGWLRSVSLARFVNDEQVRFFRSEPHLRDTFDRAREATLFGAAPLGDVLRSVGPAVYAQRLARDRSVALVGAQAPNGSAVLSSVARELAWTTGDARLDDLARRWFGGVASEPVRSERRYDLYVGPRDHALDAPTSVFLDVARDGERAVVAVEPIPSDVMVSFDAEDAPSARAFAVTEAAVPLRLSRAIEPSRGGTSAGTIALVVRDDAERTPDADLDAARELARSLRAEGFDASVEIAGRVDPARVDVIHVFDLRHGAAMVQLLRDAEAAGTPVVVTPYADDRRDEAMVGASGSISIPRSSNDTVVFDEYARAFASRRISNLRSGVWYDDAASVLLARAGAAIVSSQAEAIFLRERFGYDRTTVPIAATIPLERPSDRIASLVGPDDFVLIHAPIEARCNQLFAVMAAERLGLPIVLLGPVADVEYYRYVNEGSGPRTVQLRDHELTPAEIAGLYGRARVVADVGWSARGLHRLARGGATGAALVANLSGYANDLWGDLAVLVDPASLDAIAEALRLAWEAQPRIGSAVAARTAERCDPFAGLVAVLSAYQASTLLTKGA